MCILSFTRTKMMFRLIVFFAAFDYFIIAEPPYKPCHPDDPINNSTVLMEYAQCNVTSSFCAIRRGVNITAAISFVPDHTLKRLSNVLYFEFQGVRINHPQVHGTSACDSVFTYPDKIKSKCPLEQGKRYIYEITNYVNSTLPKIPKVIVHWAIRDKDTKKDVLCYEVIVKLI